MDNNTVNVYTTYDSVFLNSDAMFIEYDDVIKSPFFNYLTIVQNTDALSSLVDTSVIRGLDDAELYEWYRYRNDQLIFLSLNLTPSAKKSLPNDNTVREWGWKFLYNSIDIKKDLLDIDVLPFDITLRKLMETPMVKQYYVYTPIFSSAIKEELSNYKKSITYVYGDLNDVLIKHDIPFNSTFVFSDLKKILNLKETNKLNQSSVIVADRYGYNYKYKDYVIDLKNLGKGCIFKLNFFNNIYI
jgi:hypothetical protein